MKRSLSLGQMIDELNIGDKAIGSDGTVVRKGESGSIIRVNGVGRYVGYITAQGRYLNQKWDIVPKTVSFDEAKRAYTCGDTIRCEWGKDPYGEPYVEYYRIDNEKDISFEMILFGKWTIMEDDIDA